MKRMEKLLLDSKKHLQSIMTLYLSDFTSYLTIANIINLFLPKIFGIHLHKIIPEGPF